MNKITYRNFGELIQKAYVEGIYSDNTQNRKLGRVGMSYDAYAKMIKEGKAEKPNSSQETAKERAIPEYVSDLNFIKSGGREYAKYQVDDILVEVEVSKDIKYKDTIYKLTTTAKRWKEKDSDKATYENLTATQLSRKMKEIKQNPEDLPISEIFPSTEEELLAKWGKDWGYTYTYIKDNLDLKIWIRQDSDKSNPKLNLYVIDTTLKKRRSFLNLSLQEIHNELLKYDLNPDIEKPLEGEDLKKYNELKKETNLEEGQEVEAESILKKYKALNKKGKIQNEHFNIDGHDIKLLNLSKENESITITVDDNLGKQKIVRASGVVEVANTIKDIEEGNFQYFEDEFNMDIDTTLKFNRHGTALAKVGDIFIQVRTSEDNKEYTDISVYENKGETAELKEIQSVKTEDLDSAFKNLNLEVTPDSQITYFGSNAYFDGKPKDVIKSYSHKDTLKYTPGILNNEPRMESGTQKQNSALNNKGLVMNRWNKDKIDSYLWATSRKFVNWLDDMPSPKNKTKREVYFEVLKEVDRITPFNNKVSKISEGNQGVKEYIIDKYY